MLFFKKPAPPLTRFQAPTAADVTSKYQTKAPPAPGQTSGEYLQSLEKNKQSTEAVNFLAHGMPERESTWWACQSSRQVEGKLNAADRSALSAAETWVKNPTPDTKAAAATAAAKTDFTGPGGWAAQAAAWSNKPAPTAAAPAAAPASPQASLTAPAVAGAVLLAAGLVNRPAMPEAQKPKPDLLQAPKPPEAPALRAPEVSAVQPPAVSQAEQSKFAKTLQPFIDLGKDVASGQNTWA